MSVPAFVGTLPEWWQKILLPYLPASALHSLSGAASPDALEYLALVPAAAERVDALDQELEAAPLVLLYSSL